MPCYRRRDRGVPDRPVPAEIGDGADIRVLHDDVSDGRGIAAIRRPWTSVKADSMNRSVDQPDVGEGDGRIRDADRTFEVRIEHRQLSRAVDRDVADLDTLNAVKSMTG